ncbi:UDP-N-acetylmuramoyl-tripeptide--D-alanyl-D-alanine ligase [Aquisalimonas sp.]|uniref:UDP-N-acetylmuramoyl-tripeptide--D-alanyl-D- alanine ligase n=1 Tax=Aquisalimonas sp. TaxID=1872621 RepID=UPI0025BFCFDB|nr:UDP-N-acetylmuramoyl-tripeptide--D-alanyl-D-alanine ligase [Aquisalimonas sp.]
MIRLRLDELIRPLSAELSGPAVEFTGVATDSRHVRRGELFVALQGERFDGHRFVQQALDRGAAAVMVSVPIGVSAPVVTVPDTRRALGELARLWRRRSRTRIVAVTGSNGKTTVKEMLAAILQREAPTLATQGNYNNDIGVPLTLFRLGEAHRLAVIEMGANHAGEIAWLAGIAEPDIGLVTNAGPSHLEGFGSLEGVARAKGELFQGLPGWGTAVINADDPHAGLWRDLAAGVAVSDFGMEHHASVVGTETAGGLLTVTTAESSFSLKLPVPGRHNRYNALAALTAARALGVGADRIRRALETFQPVAGRLTPRTGLAGSVLLDDSYNANPASLVAGLEVLVSAARPRWLVLGDMGELGADALELHAYAGHRARELGVDRLFTTGPLSAAASEAFGEGASHFADTDGLIETLRDALEPGVTVLIKGSRSMGMESIVGALQVPEPARGEG